LPNASQFAYKQDDLPLVMNRKFGNETLLIDNNWNHVQVTFVGLFFSFF